MVNRQVVNVVVGPLQRVPRLNDVVDIDVPGIPVAHGEILTGREDDGNAGSYTLWPHGGFVP